MTTPVTLPNGETVRFPDGTAPETINAEMPKIWASIQAQSKQEAPEQPGQEEVGTLEFMLDQIKSEGGQLVESLLPGWAQKMVTGGASDPWRDFREEYGKGLSVRELQESQHRRGDEIGASLFGHEGLEPETEADRYLGIGARAVADPMNVVGMGGKNLAGKAVSVGMEYLYGAASYAGGAAAGELGRETAEEMGAPEWGQDLIADIVSALAGGTLNIGRTGVETGARMAGDTISGLRPRTARDAEGNKTGTYTKAGDAVSDFISTAEVQSVIGKAAAAEGGALEAKVRSARELMDTFPGLVLPTAAVAGDNPIIRKNFSELYAKYPEWRGKYDMVQKEAVARLRSETDKVIGSVDVDQAKLRQRIDGHSTQEIAKAEKLHRQRMDAVDAQMDAVAAKMTSKTTPDEIGRAAQGILQAKEKAARDAVKPVYKKAFRIAEANDIKLPKESVGKVFNTIKDMNAMDIFASFPGLTKTIKQKWSPRPEEYFTHDSSGVIVKARRKAHRDVEVKDADSLKRAINKALRTTKDESHQRVLMHLKDVLSQEIGKLPSEFSRQYKAADHQFAKALGIPKNKAGVRALDRARFESSVGQQLNKFDQARDYLNMVGEQGLPVVRDSIMLAAERAAVNPHTLEINPVALSRFARNNKNVIDLVPGLKGELAANKATVESLRDTGARLDSDFNATSLKHTEGFYQAVHKKNLGAVAGEILTSPEKRAQYLSEIKGMPADVQNMAMLGVRQAMLDKAAQHQGSMLDFIKDNHDAFGDYFSKSYLKDLENISSALDVLNAMESSKGASSRDFKDQDRLQRVTGVNAEEVIGTLRNQVLSSQRKALHLGSKMFLRSSAKKRDKQLMDLLINVRGIEDLGRAAARVEQAAQAGAAGSSLRKAAGRFTTTLLGRIAKGGALGEAGYNALVNEDYPPELRTLTSVAGRGVER